MTFARPSKRVVAAVGAVLLLGLGGVAVAQTTLDDRAAERQAFLDDVAKRLDVTPAQLEQAFKDANLARIDQELAEGKITQEQADQMKEHVESGEGPIFGFGPGGDRGRHGGFGLGHGGFGHGKLHKGGPGFFDAATGYLGVTEADLEQAFKDGKSLADLAQEKGKPVQGLEDAIVASVAKRLDEAVTAGRITPEQKTEFLQRFSEHVSELVQGTPGKGRGWHGEKPGDDEPGPGEPDPTGA